MPILIHRQTQTNGTFCKGGFVSWLDNFLGLVYVATAIMFLFSFWPAMIITFTVKENEYWGKAVTGSILSIPMSGVCAYVYVSTARPAALHEWAPAGIVISMGLFLILAGGAFITLLTNWNSGLGDAKAAVKAILCIPCAVIMLILIHATR
jgi:hypothetical protein